MKTFKWITALLFVEAIFLQGTQLHSQSNPAFSGKFTGVFRKNANPTKMRMGVDWANLGSEIKEFEAGYRVLDIETYTKDGKRLYDLVFEKADGSYAVKQHKSWDNFMTEWHKQKNAGRILIDIETFKSGADQYFIGVFRSSSKISTIITEGGWDNFTARWNQLSNQGYILADAESAVYEGKQQYIGVFRGGSGNALFQHSDWGTFLKIAKEQEDKNYRMVDFEYFSVGNKPMFLAVMHKGSDGHGFWHNVAWSSFDEKRKAWADSKLYLVDYERF